MPDRVLTGSRLRNRRLDRGLRQADVARAVGISGSYLNLIEHNRRRIGGKLLQDLARVLEVDPGLLEDETDASVMVPLREAIADMPGAQIDAARIEELVAKFPGVAALIVAQRNRISQLEAQVEALGNRLAHDTQIATSLHEVISTATSIRSTASILVESPDLDPDWQSRFHGNIDGDAQRLAQSSQALLGLLDTDIQDTQAASAVEQAEAIWAQHDGLWTQPGPARSAVLMDLPDAAVKAQIARWVTRIDADEAQAPLADLAAAARKLAFDPARLAAHLAAPLDLVLRRLAHLPATDDAPQMGLAQCDAAGVLTFHKPVLDFRLPRSGAACPLWPLYQALTQPGRAIRRVVRLPGAAHTTFECIAIARLWGAVDFDTDPRVEATMLVRPARGETQVSPVGPGCRVCAIKECASRRQASVLRPDTVGPAMAPALTS